MKRLFFLYYFHDNSAHNGYPENTAESIALHLAGLAEKSGLDGVVCSPLESLSIKKMFGDYFNTLRCLKISYAETAKLTEALREVMLPAIGMLNIFSHLS